MPTRHASTVLAVALSGFEDPMLRPLSYRDPISDTRGFDGGYLEPGRLYRRAFAAPGAYSYSDAAGHSGTVVVVGEPPFEVFLPLVLRKQPPQ